MELSQTQSAHLMLHNFWMTWTGRPPAFKRRVSVKGGGESFSPKNMDLTGILVYLTSALNCSNLIALKSKKIAFCNELNNTQIWHIILWYIIQNPPTLLH